MTFADIESAAQRINGVAHRTPVFSSRTADERCGGRLFLKCENLQRAGAFKFRGAYNALSALSAAERARGVLTYSSGNHAQALALAGKLLTVPITVVMPADAPAVKAAATQEYGAEIVRYDKHETTRESLGRRLAAERGLSIVPPYDHPAIVAGQGTTALELLSDIPDLDVMLVPCGGGGLLSGCAVAARHLSPACRVIGVEPELADDATRSFKTGVLHTVSNPETVADGARTPSLGEVTFPLVRRYVDDMVTVSERAIVEAMFFLWERMKLVVEPTGALAYAAISEEIVDVRGKRAGIIITGGNVDLKQAITLLAAI